MPHFAIRLAGVDPTDDMAASFGLPEIDSLDMWPSSHFRTGVNLPTH